MLGNLLIVFVKEIVTEIKHSLTTDVFTCYSCFSLVTIGNASVVVIAPWPSIFAFHLIA